MLHGNITTSPSLPKTKRYETWYWTHWEYADHHPNSRVVLLLVQKRGDDRQELLPYYKSRKKTCWKKTPAFKRNKLTTNMDTYISKYWESDMINGFVMYVLYCCLWCGPLPNSRDLGVKSRELQLLLEFSDRRYPFRSEAIDHSWTKARYF